MAVHYQILMGKLHRGADRSKHPQPLMDAQASLLDIVCNGSTRDVLHHQVRSAIIGDAAIQQTRDVEVVEAGQNLVLLPKRLKTKPVSIPRLTSLMASCFSKSLQRMARYTVPMPPWPTGSQS